MKECPICKAHCFSDMDICYGCMHVFSKEKAETISKGAERQATINLPILELEKSSMQARRVTKELENGLLEEEVSEKEIRAKHRAEPAKIKEEDVFQAEYQLVISLKPTGATCVKTL